MPTPFGTWEDGGFWSCTVSVWSWLYHSKLSSAAGQGRDGCPDIYFSQGLVGDLARERAREAVKWFYREQCREAGHPGKSQMGVRARPEEAL